MLYRIEIVALVSGRHHGHHFGAVHYPSTPVRPSATPRRFRPFPAGSPMTTGTPQPFPLYMTHGAGPRKWDVDSNEYIDYVCGHGATAAGSFPSGHRRCGGATNISGHPSGGIHRRGAALGSGHQGAGAFHREDSLPQLGTEATLMAMRLARAYTGKNKIISSCKTTSTAGTTMPWRVRTVPHRASRRKAGPAWWWSPPATLPRWRKR